MSLIVLELTEIQYTVSHSTGKVTFSYSIKTRCFSYSSKHYNELEPKTFN